MGSSSSSTTNQKYTTNIVNTTDTNILDKSVNNFVANTVTSQAAACSANISQLQTVDLSNMKIAGDLNIGEIDQSQKAAMTFDCVQVSSFKNDLANGVMSQYMGAIQNSFSSETLDKLTAQAGAAAKNSFGATGSSHSDSTTNTDYTFNSTNTTNTNIQHVVENAITNNMSMEDVKNCIAQIHNTQSVSVAGTSVGGSVNIGAIRQDQAATLMAECIQKTDNGNKITSSIASELGIVLDNSNKQTKSTELSSTATSESTNQGVGESLGAVFAGIGSMFGNIFGAALGMWVGPCLIVCIILCVISSIGFCAMQMMGGSSVIREQVEDMSDDNSGSLFGGFIKMIGGNSVNSRSNLSFCSNGNQLKQIAKCLRTK